MKKSIIFHRPLLTGIVLCFSLLFVSVYSSGQVARFQRDINHFKKQDSSQFPPKHAILFIGSSTFTKWVDVDDYFPGYTIINRGFGGSSLPDLIRYVPDIIIPYEPRQIVIYCGDNDLAASDTVTAKTVLGRFKRLVVLIRQQLPDVQISFVSIKPSPSRQRLMPEMVKANRMVRKYLKRKKNASFINVYRAMLTKDGTPNKAIFLKDELHMNAEGYAIWQKIIEPYLLK